MSCKKSIYISDNAEKIIGEIDDNTNLSGRINSIIVRYGAVMDIDCPALMAKEWMLLCDILNSTWKDTDSAKADISPRLWAEVADSEQDGVGEKWGVNCEEFSQRLRTMGYSSLCAITEVVCRFWQGHHTGEYPEILLNCGAKLK